MGGEGGEEVGRDRESGEWQGRGKGARGRRGRRRGGEGRKVRTPPPSIPAFAPVNYHTGWNDGVAYWCSIF